MAELTVEPVRDTYLSGVSKNANYGAGQYSQARIVYVGDTKAAWERALGEFDVSELAGATIGSAKLVRHVWSLPGGGGHDAVLTRCSRPGEWVESQVSWNQYKSGATWTTEGGDVDDNVPGKLTYSEPTSTGDHEISGLATYVVDALANRGGIVSLLIRLADEDPDVDQGAVWRTKEYGADVWRLTIEYTPAPDEGGRRSLRTGRRRPPALRPARADRPTSGLPPARARRTRMRRLR